MKMKLLLPILLLPACSALPDDPVAEGESAVATAKVPVYFNHSYGIYSAATVTALQTNAYVKDEFIDVEVRTTVRPDFTYTGTYLNARETYMEFFPEGTLGMTLGTTGIGLGTERKDGLTATCKKWEATFGEGQAPITLTSREVNGVQVPWFNACDLGWAASSSYTGFWAMEYVPNAGSTVPRTRQEERAARYAPNKLAQNVQAVVFALEPGDYDNVKKSLASANWKIVTLGSSYVAFSPNDAGTTRSIAVEPASAGRLGQIGIVWRLNRLDTRTETLGDATLEVGTGGLPFATMWFVAPAASETQLTRAALPSGS